MTRAETGTAIFVCSNDTHVRIFDPVARELAERHGLGSHLLSLDHSLDQGAGPAAAATGRSWEHLACPEPLRGPYWRDPARRRVAKRRVASKAFATLLASHKPAAVAVGHDASVIEWPLVQVARARGVAAILVQDGIRSSFERHQARPARWKSVAWAGLRKLGCLTTPPGLGYGHGSCDQIAVYGEALRRALTEEGVSRDKIVVTGNPRFDALARLSQAGVREELGLSQERLIAVLATQPFAQAGLLSEMEEDELLHSVLEQYARLPTDMVLLLKLHPRESPEKYVRRLTEWKLRDRLRVLQDADSMKVVVAGDIVIGFHSTVILEALAAGRRVVVLDLLARVETALGRVENPYAAANLAPVVADVSQLADAVAQAQAGGPWERNAAAFLEDQCFRIDGFSARRVAGVIAEAARRTEGKTS